MFELQLVKLLPFCWPHIQLFSLSPFKAMASRRYNEGKWNEHHINAKLLDLTTGKSTRVEPG